MSVNGSKVLVVDDDAALAEMLQIVLQASGFDTVWVGRGDEVLEEFRRFRPDLVLLDLMLPGMDGFQLCRSIRADKDTPILIVSARHEEIDKIRALGIGADDYIVKPFSPSELVARVKAHIARYDRLTGKDAQTTQRVLHTGVLEIQLDTHRVLTAGREVSLTNREFELLAFLAQNPGIVFSRERLFERVWGLDAAGDTATVMVHINRIREKIEPDPAKPIYIETLWGAGYRFHG